MSEDIFKSAIIHHGKKNFSKAKEIYESLLKINPNNIAVLENFSVLNIPKVLNRLIPLVFLISLLTVILQLEKSRHRNY